MLTFVVSVVHLHFDPLRASSSLLRGDCNDPEQGVGAQTIFHLQYLIHSVWSASPVMSYS